MKFCRFVIALIFIAMFTACAGVDPNPYGKLLSAPSIVGTETTTDLDDLTQKNGLTGLPGAAQCNVTVSQIVYATQGVQPGELTNASAAVLVPSGPKCPGPFPLIAFGRATVMEKMQANADLTNPSTEMLMTFFAAQGYAVVATDFSAMLNPPTHITPTRTRPQKPARSSIPSVPREKPLRSLA